MARKVIAAVAGLLLFMGILLFVRNEGGFVALAALVQVCTAFLMITMLVCTRPPS